MPRASRPPSRPARLQVEALEERCVPTSAQFVNSLFQDLLGRAASPAEVAAQVAALNASRNPAVLAQGFLTSPEFLGNQIRSDYLTFLGRVPNPAELNFWLAQRQGGLTGRQQTAFFLASDEFFARAGGNPAAWLNNVFLALLARPVDGFGSTFFLTSVAQGATRSLVATQIAFSPEAGARLVNTVFTQLLRRPADQGGQTFFVTQLNSGLAPSGLLTAIVLSPEFLSLRGGGALDFVVPVVIVPPAAGPGLTTTAVSTVPVSAGGTLTTVTTLSAPLTTAVTQPALTTANAFRFNFPTFGGFGLGAAGFSTAVSPFGFGFPTTGASFFLGSFGG